jgi:DNA-binding NarL/FixJ family response regulator
VWHWLNEGKTGREVALILKCAPCTVESHVTRLYRKLGAHNRLELLGTRAKDFSERERELSEIMGRSAAIIGRRVEERQRLEAACKAILRILKHPASAVAAGVHYHRIGCPCCRRRTGGCWPG